MAELIRVISQRFTRFLLVLGVWGLVWGLLWPGVAVASSELSPLSFVPRQSAWMVSLTQPLNQLPPALRPVVTNFLRQQWQQLGLGRVGDDLLALQPGLTLANTSPISAGTPHPVWVVPIKDRETAEKSLAKLWQAQAMTPQSETVQGLTLISPGPNLAVTIVGDDYLLVSDSAQALREALTTAQSSSNSLLGASFYREANLSLNRETWGLSYVNLGIWQDVSALMSPDRLLLEWQTLKTPLLGLGIKTTLIRAQTPDFDTQSSSSTPVNPELAKNLPDAAAVILGHDLPTFWAQVQTLLSHYGQGSEFLTQVLQASSQALGIDLTTEVWPWLTGDFGLAWVLHPTDPLGPNHWHWQLTTPRSPTVIAGLETLTDTLTSQGWLKTPPEADALTPQAWSPSEASPPVFSQGQTGNWLTLATDQTELIPSDTTPPAWHSLMTRNAPKTLIHLDWAKSSPAWEETFPLLKLLAFAAPSVFDHLDGITWLGVDQQGRASTAELILAWEK